MRRVDPWAIFLLAALVAVAVGTEATRDNPVLQWMIMASWLGLSTIALLIRWLTIRSRRRALLRQIEASAPDTAFAAVHRPREVPVFFTHPLVFIRRLPEQLVILRPEGGDIPVVIDIDELAEISVDSSRYRLVVRLRDGQALALRFVSRTLDDVSLTELRRLRDWLSGESAEPLG